MAKNKMQQFASAVDEVRSPAKPESIEEKASVPAAIGKTPSIVFADLPLISKLPPAEMSRAQSLLEELDSIKQINQMNKEREDEVEAELEEIQKGAGLLGLRWGPWAFAWRMMEGRKTLSVEKLVEEGVSAEVIERCKVQGSRFAKREFRNLKSGVRQIK